MAKATGTAVLEAPEAGFGWVARLSVAALQKAVAKVKPAVPTKTPMPILLGLRIEAESGLLRLSATDLTTFITTECEAEVEDGGGAIVLPAMQLADLLAKIPPAGNVALGSDGCLMWGLAEYRLPLMDADALPRCPGLEGGESCEVTASVLRRMLAACSPIAQASDASRPILGAVALTVEGGRVTQAQATDGTRVARVWADRPADMDHPATALANCLVPATATKALLAALDETEDADPVPLVTDRSWLAVSVPGVRLQVRLLDGRYVDLGGVLDRYERGESFAVNRRVLAGALDRMAVVAQAKREFLQTVVLEVDAGGITLVIDGEAGRGRERIEADAGGLSELQGDDAPGKEGVLRAVGFSCLVLPDLLRALSGEECRVALGGRLMPGGWWGDEPVRFDVMPIRVGG